MKVPPGGRMGIPRCGGMHGARSENLCYDCQTLIQSEKQTKALEQLITLVEYNLTGERRAPRQPYVPPPPPPKPVVKGGMNVKPQ